MMLAAFLTRRRDDHGYLHTKEEVEGESHAMAKALSLLRAEPDIVHVEVFIHFKDDGYCTWFRLGREARDVQSPIPPPQEERTN